MIVTRIDKSIASFSNSTAVSEAIDMTSMMGASVSVVVTGAGGAGSMKLQVSNDPATSTSWIDLPTSTTAPTTQTINVGTTPHYMNTGYIGFFAAMRVSVTSTNANAITVAIKGTAKGG